MNAKNLLMIVVLSTGMLTALTATNLMSVAIPAFAGGHDHHHHSDKTCKDNGDNNCNDKHNTQKIKSKNECEIENINKHHSKDNDNTNSLVCVSQNANLRGTALVNSSVFD
jgi:hypothetical protein